MRWSLSVSSIFTLLFAAICFEHVFSLPAPYDDSEGGSLVARARLRSGKSLKASSKTYRKAATLHPYKYSGKKRLSSNSRHALKKTHDADHLLEHQTVLHALKKIGHSPSSLPPKAHHELKAIFNHPHNLALIHKSINRSKGQAMKQGLAGNTPTTIMPGVADHAHATKPLALATARKLDAILHSHKLVTKKNKNLIEKTHTDAAAAAGLRRR
jgi:hypothetical protein